MFGYVVADQSQLSKEEYRRYRSLYCGLCRALNEKGKMPAQMTLTYDMTFLVMVLSSLYEPPEKEVIESCVSHPFRKCRATVSEITEYAADMNIILAYYNILDDVEDENKLIKKAQLKLLKKSFLQAKSRNKIKAEQIKNSLNDLSLKEKQNADADECANVFAKIMQTVFTYKEDMWRGFIADFAAALGRLIYIMDAADDVEKDIKKHTFNPFKEMFKKEHFYENINDILECLTGDCIAAFEKLPLLADVSIMKNVLCCGLWQKFDAKRYLKTHANKKEIQK